MGYYVTEADYVRAVENGIPRGLVSQRVYQNGWEVERAVTQKPVHGKRVANPWRKVAEENGVARATYYKRIELGWTPEQAATTNGVNRLTPEEALQLDRAGVARDTFRHRIRDGWPREAALSTATIPNNQRRYGRKI